MHKLKDTTACRLSLFRPTNPLCGPYVALVLLARSPSKTRTVAHVSYYVVYINFIVSRLCYQQGMHASFGTELWRSTINEVVSM